MRLLSRVGIQVVGLAGLALPVVAQQVRPTLAPSVFAEVALPRGDVHSFTNMGFTTGASLDLGANSIPVALRAEAGYTHFAFTYTDLGSNQELSGGNRNQWNGGLDLVVPIPMRVATPYLLGGYGVYRVAIRPNCHEIFPPGAVGAELAASWDQRVRALGRRQPSWATSDAGDQVADPLIVSCSGPIDRRDLFSRGSGLSPEDNGPATCVPVLRRGQMNWSDDRSRGVGSKINDFGPGACAELVELVELAARNRRVYGWLAGIPLTGATMYCIREVMYCKPGKVRELVEKFKAMTAIGVRNGEPKMRIMTDFCAEQYWTVVAEMEVPTLDAFEKMMSSAGGSGEDAKEMQKIMKGYHDLVDHGKREIYKIES